MYFRTTKILAILLKWHRLLALHGMRSFPVSLFSAVQRDPDPSWDIVLLHYSRIWGDYQQKPQIWQKFQESMGLPSGRPTTEQTRGDESLRAPRKNSGANRDAGMQWRQRWEGKRGFSGMFERCWLLSGKGQEMLEVTGTDHRRGWEQPQSKQGRKRNSGDILHESLVGAWTLPTAKFRVHSTGRSTKEQKSVPWMPRRCTSPAAAWKVPPRLCLWDCEVVWVAQAKLVTC